MSNFKICQVKGCISCNTHITSLHICPICNCRGHGPEECEDRYLIRNLERDSVDSLPRHLHCQNPYCPKKETHMTNVCHQYIKLVERLWKKIEVDTNNLILYHNSEFGNIQRNTYNIFEKKIAANNYRMIKLALKIPLSLNFGECKIYARLVCVRHTNSEQYLDIEYILVKPENLTRNDIKNESNLLNKFLENYEILFYQFELISLNISNHSSHDYEIDESNVYEESSGNDETEDENEDEEITENNNDTMYDELRSIESDTIIDIIQTFPDIHRINENSINNRHIINIVNHQRSNLIIGNSLFNPNNNSENNDEYNTDNGDETMDDEYDEYNDMPPLEPVETNINDSNINDSNVYLDDTIAHGISNQNNVSSRYPIRLKCPECRTVNIIPINNSMVKGINKECSVCLNAVATTYFPQCGHIVCCQECLFKLPRI